MRAIVCPRYGGPEVLELREVEDPVITDRQVLVQVRAAAVNPLDWRVMRADPGLIRLMFGLTRPNIKVMGADIAGVVEAVGREVASLRVGDEVFGDISAQGWGGFSELAAGTEEQLVPKPANADFEEAAALPVAGITALQGLRDHARVQAGERVLVNGAMGGVGHLAVQVAKAYGAEVTGVCSPAKVKGVRELGADHVIDYTKEDFAKGSPRYDVIFDTAAHRSVREPIRALAPKGRYVMVGGGASPMFEAMLLGGIYARGEGRRALTFTANANRTDLLALKELVEAGKVRPVLERRFPLERTAEAIAHLEQGHASGKTVVTLDVGA